MGRTLFPENRASGESSWITIKGSAKEEREIQQKKPSDKVLSMTKDLKDYEKHVKESAPEVKPEFTFH